MRKTYLLVCLALAPLLVACGGGSRAHSSSSAPPSAAVTTPAANTTTLTPEPDPTPTVTPFAPNVGDRALRVGQRRQGRDFVTTLQEIRYPYPPAEYRDPKDGDVFVGLRVKQCYRKTSKPVDDAYSTYNGEWYVATPSGDQYPGNGESWSDWPSPKFPENVTLNPGDCLHGWLDVEVPEGIRIKKIVWRSEGETTAEWLPVTKAG